MNVFAVRGRAGTLVLVLALAACASAPKVDTDEPSLRPVPRSAGTVVLVHGAWSGGWAWRPVDRLLTEQGWDVYRPTLTGLGERVHLIGPDVDLSTHVRDVVNLILFERLENVVLVGHSYAGMVITGVADSIPERLRALIYVDAFLPLGGESLVDIAGRPVEGEALVPSWVDLTAPYPRDVPHPAGTMRQPVELDGAPGAGVPAAYILTREVGQETDDFEGMADRARELGWPVRELEADHNAQRTNPEGLVQLIEEIGGG